MGVTIWSLKVCGFARCVETYGGGGEMMMGTIPYRPWWEIFWNA